MCWSSTTTRRTGRILEELLRLGGVVPTMASSGVEALAAIETAQRQRSAVPDAARRRAHARYGRVLVRRGGARAVRRRRLDGRDADVRSAAGRSRSMPRAGLAAHLTKPIQHWALEQTMLGVISREAAAVIARAGAQSRRRRAERGGFASCGRGQHRQPEARGGAVAAAATIRSWSPTAGRRVDGVDQRAGRRHLHGRPDARDGRLPGHCAHPRRRARQRHARAHRRDDRARHDRRSRTLSRGGDGRLRDQTDLVQGSRSDPAAGRAGPAA